MKNVELGGEKTILKLLSTWLHSNITPFSRVIVPVVLSSLISTDPLLGQVVERSCYKVI